jgi:hypothetical protein
MPTVHVRQEREAGHEPSYEREVALVSDRATLCSLRRAKRFPSIHVRKPSSA